MPRLTQLKLRRLEAGIVQIELAHLAGISRCKLSEIENGYLAPSAAELERLASAIGVTVEALTPSPPDPAAV